MILNIKRIIGCTLRLDVGNYLDAVHCWLQPMTGAPRKKKKKKKKKKANVTQGSCPMTNSLPIFVSELTGLIDANKQLSRLKPIARETACVRSSRGADSSHHQSTN